MKVLRAVLTVVAAGVLMAGCGSSTPSATTSSSPPTASATESMSPTPSPTPSSTPSATATGAACTGNIRVIPGQAQGAAGHRTLVLVFNNVGTTTCTITGYPGVDLVSSHGATVAHAQRTLSGMAGGVASVQPVTLNAGQSASALVEASSVPRGSIQDCGSYSLRVTPPGQYTSVPAGTATMPMCDLQIHPVVAGTGGGMH